MPTIESLQSLDNADISVFCKGSLNLKPHNRKLTITIKDADDNETFKDVVEKDYLCELVSQESDNRAVVILHRMPKTRVFKYTILIFQAKEQRDRVNNAFIAVLKRNEALRQELKEEGVIAVRTKTFQDSTPAGAPVVLTSSATAPEPVTSTSPSEKLSPTPNISPGKIPQAPPPPPAIIKGSAGTTPSATQLSSNIPQDNRQPENNLSPTTSTEPSPSANIQKPPIAEKPNLQISRDDLLRDIRKGKTLKKSSEVPPEKLLKKEPSTLISVKTIIPRIIHHPSNDQKDEDEWKHT